VELEDAPVIAAVALLAIAGYGAARGILRSRDALAAAALGIASAWALFIVLLNLLLRAHIAFPPAVFVAYGAVVGLGAWGWLRARSWGPAVVDRLDLALLGILGSAVSAFVLLYQFIGPDSDNFIHYPLVALFMRGQFPHINPYFPDISLYGHYGRDLGLAGLLTFGGTGIGTGMMIEAWILHLATIGNTYYLGIRAGGGRVGGFVVAYLAFFGVNSGFADWVLRSGLAEVSGNNNPVVYAFFFAVLVLCSALLEDPRWETAAAMGVLLGGLDMVYETHFDILFASLGMVWLSMFLPRMRERMRPRARAMMTASLGLAFVVMLASGGLTSRMVLQRLGRSPGATASSAAADWARAGAQQDVRIGFPKRPFLTLTHAHDGRAVRLFSASFLAGQGVALSLLPLAAIFLACRGNVIGLLTAMAAILSLGIPASFDFGRFNGENFRFIFLGGLAAALTLGIAIGGVFAWISGRRRSVWIRCATLVAIGALCAWQGSRAWAAYQYAAQMCRSFPQIFRLAEAERLQQFCMTWGRGDEEAALFLRGHGRKGERLATNYVVEDHAGSNLLYNAMVVMSQARLPMTGFDQRLQHDTGGIQGSVSGWSGQAIAFWATGDVDLLRDLRADWLYVVPFLLPPAASLSLQNAPAVSPAFRSEHGADRLVLRVDRARLPTRPKLSAATASSLSVVRVTVPESLPPETFQPVEVSLGNSGRAAVEGNAYVYYRLFDVRAGSWLDDSDSVGAVQELAVPASGEQRFRIPFVVPYNEGEYQLQLSVLGDPHDVVLGSAPIQVGPGLARSAPSARIPR
jgi:hypothetical protein